METTTFRLVNPTPGGGPFNTQGRMSKQVVAVGGHGLPNSMEVDLTVSHTSHSRTWGDSSESPSLQRPTVQIANQPMSTMAASGPCLYSIQGTAPGADAVVLKWVEKVFKGGNSDLSFVLLPSDGNASRSECPHVRVDVSLNGPQPSGKILIQAMSSIIEYQPGGMPPSSEPTPKVVISQSQRTPWERMTSVFRLWEGGRRARSRTRRNKKKRGRRLRKSARNPVRKRPTRRRSVRQRTRTRKHRRV